MIGPLLGIGGIGVVLIVSEILYAAKLIKTEEAARKLVHILSGIWISLWPLLMSFRAIQLLSLLLLLVVLASKYLKLFRSIHGVSRQTYGELLFPIGVLISATFAATGSIYAAAVLHLSLADGFAAVIGVRHIKKSSYKVFGHIKTIAGSAAFYLISLFITTVVVAYDFKSYESIAPAVIFWLPLAATMVENVALFGSDNVLVPVLIIAVLNSLQSVA